MAEAQLRQFLEKVRQLNAFVALSEADPRLRQELTDCEHHDQVVALARRCGFEIGRRWGEPLPAVRAADSPPEAVASAPPPGLGDGSHAAGESAAPTWRAAAAPPATPVPAGSLVAGTAAAGPAAASPGQPDQAGGSAAVHGDRITSLLQPTCPPPGQEQIHVLLQTPQWRLVRIHSCDAVSPPGFWYDQAEHEWLTLLQGSAGLRFADETHDRRLQPGDSLLISVGRRHRVTATDSAPGTIWLALFWCQAGAAA